MRKTLSFRTRLFAMVLPTMVALVALAVATVRPRIQAADQAQVKAESGIVAQAAMQLLDEVQFESSLAMRYLLAVDSSGREELDIQREQTSIQRENFRALASAFEASGQTEADLLRNALTAATRIDELRQSVDSRSADPDVLFNESTNRQRALALLATELARSAGPSGLSGQGNLIATFLELKELRGTQYLYGASRGDARTWQPSDVASYRAHSSTADRAASTYAALAPANSLAAYQKLLAGSDLASADELTRAILAAAEQGQPSPVSVRQWVQTTNAALGAFDVIDDQHFAEYLIGAKSVQRSQERSALLWAAIATRCWLRPSARISSAGH